MKKFKEKAAAAKAKLAEAAGGGKALFVKHGGGSILKILASDELQLFVIKEGPTKKILESLQKDCKNGDVDFKLTIGYFKEQVTQKKDEAESIVEERKTKLKTSFYNMLKAKQINAKAEGQWVKATNKALSSIPSPGKELVKAYVEKNELNKYSKFTGIIENTYKSQKDEKRVAFNILGSLLTDTANDTNVFKANFIKDLENLGKKVINEGKKKVEAAVNKAPAPKDTKKGGENPPAATDKKDTKDTGKFGKRKRGPSASLKRMCKKNGVRLTVKRGKTRVYKSSKVLKEQCQRKLKKNFGRKKIKRYGIMPPKRKRRGKKRKTTSKKRKTTMRQRLSAAADYARGHPGTIAGYAAAGLGGAGALGLAGLEASRARGRYLLDKDNADLLKVDEAIRQENQGQKAKFKEYQRKRAALASPIFRGFTRGRKTLLSYKEDLEDFSKVNMEAKKQILSELSTRQIESIKDAAEQAYQNAMMGGMSLRDRITGLFKKKEEDEEAAYGKRRRRKRRRFGDNCSTHKKPTAYGKRRRRKSKYDFGKKAKKPSAATRRMCKKLKVRMTLKRGKKRVYKSESMLKKQCKKAMKRRKKK